MIDLHTHSAVSDGTDSPEELVRAAAEAGLSVIALTDHDTFEGLPEARAEGRVRGVGVLGGIELSTLHDGHSVHLLGYGCDPSHPELARELERIGRSRVERIPQMIRLLTQMGMPLTVREVEAQAAGVSVGRPHVADALVARGYVSHRNEAFATLLHDGGPAYVHRYSPPLTRGIELVRGAGGVAVIAHPWGRGGRSHLPLSVLESLIRETGLDGLRWTTTTTTGSRLRNVRRGGAGPARHGGSDYHGTGKTNHPWLLHHLARGVRGDRGGDSGQGGTH